MAKKSRKMFIRPKKDNAGCMSGFISMFDFRQGHFTHKLLSDRKAWSGKNGGTGSTKKLDLLSNLEGKHEGDNDIKAKETRRASLGKASVKALMEEEMFKAHRSTKIPDSKVEQTTRTEVRFGLNHQKNHKQTTKNSTVDSNHHTDDSNASPSSVLCQSTCPKPSESSFSSANLAELMVEFCNQNSDCQEKHTESSAKLREALIGFTEAVLTQKSIDTKQISSDEEIRQSKEFMDALELLNSNKELFLKLLQDQDACKFLHGSEWNESVSCSLFHKQNAHHFFRKKDKSKGQETSNDTDISQALKRIVVLKPTPSGNQHLSNTPSPIASPKSHHGEAERATSHFSIKEIKRRLKNMKGENRKEQHSIAKDGGKARHSSQLSELLKRDDKKANSKEYQYQNKINKTAGPHPYYKGSFFYEEAKKHLTDMMSTSCESVISPTKQASKTLGKILSLAEYNLLSPIFSPRSDREIDSPRHMRYSPLYQIKQEKTTSKSPSRQGIESSSCNDRNPDDEMQTLDSNTQMQFGEDSIQKVDMETKECNQLDEPGFISEEGSCMLPEVGPCEERQPVTPSVSISPNPKSVIVQKIEDFDNVMENPDLPTPVSVLEPFFTEDTSSPERTTTEHAELKVEPQQLQFGENNTPQVILTSTALEAKLEYAKAVLEASGLCCDRLLDRWRSSDQLLDPFVFDEVEISYGQVIDDSKLLFDCINEVLVEIHERQLACTPWLSSIKPDVRPVPIGGKLVQEVCRGIAKHLDLIFPCALDQVVKKDLDVGSWMNIRFETESTIDDVGEVILEYLMEETILELWE